MSKAMNNLNYILKEQLASINTLYIILDNSDTRNKLTAYLNNQIK